MKDKSQLAARLVSVLGGFLAYDLTRRDPMTSYEEGLFPASLAEGDVELPSAASETLQPPLPF